MWQIKIKFREKWNIYNEKSLKFNLKIYFYSQTFYSEENKIYYVGIGVVEGKEENKKLFFDELGKDSKVVSLEIDNNYFICTYSEKKNKTRSKYVKIAYNKRLIFLDPVIFDEKGWEIWKVASIDKKDLDIFIKTAQENEIEHSLYFLKEEKISNIMIHTSFPKLSKKQEEVINLAISNGYYGYPRKITLNKMAQINGISLSTFQFHLAKAEEKLLPFAFKKIK